MENAANRIALTGALDTLPEYSHTNHDRNFYRLTLCVERLSGAVDLLPVLAAEDVLNEADLFRGERIAITGQVRSFNNRAPEGRRLIISVYAETLTTTDQPAQNDVSLTGSVCKPPIYRRTPLGRPPAVPPHGLHPLHSLGQKRAGGSKRPSRLEAPCDRPPAKPGLHQGHRRRELHPHGLRALGHGGGISGGAGFFGIRKFFKNHATLPLFSRLDR